MPNQSTRRTPSSRKPVRPARDPNSRAVAGPFRRMAPFLISAGPAERFTPFFEMRETQHAFVFRADLPGFEAKDLTVTLAANRLTIAGERAPDAEDPAAIYFARERDHCAFSRSFTLASVLDTELALHAELAQGVLTLVVPKLTELHSREAQLAASGGANN